MRATALLLTLLALALPTAAKDIQVLAWSERSEPIEIYPNGINGAMAEMLAGQKGLTVRTANLLDPEQGLSEAALAQTDVLIWFGHRNHEDVLDENVQRIVRHVQERGMGYLPLHSAHYAKPFVELMRLKGIETGWAPDGRIGGWKGGVKNNGAPETIRVLLPGHPIAAGVSQFVIAGTEMYSNPFVTPPPDLKVLEGSWEDGEQHGSDGLVWYLGRGKVFYFRPGHETRPIYFQPEVQQVLKNAILWLSKPHKNGS